MSIEIKTTNGKTFGFADTEDGNDFVIIDGKKTLVSELYQDAELMKEFNDEIKSSSIELTNE